MQRLGVKSAGPGAPRSVPNPGSVSAVGPSNAAPKPRIKNTRDYGKKDPSLVGPAISANPFGPTDGGSRLGGI